MNKLIKQIIKFVIVGGIATLIDFVCLYIFKEFLNLNIILSNTLSFTISVIYNYIASIKWVFDVNKNSKFQFIIFVILSVIGLLINNGILYLFTSYTEFYYLLSKVFATLVVMIYNFITRKIFLEKK